MGCEVLKYVLHAMKLLVAKARYFCGENHSFQFTTALPQSSSHFTTKCSLISIRSSRTDDYSMHVDAISLFMQCYDCMSHFSGKFTFQSWENCFTFKSTVSVKRNEKIGVGFLLIFSAPTSWKCLFAVLARKFFISFIFSLFSSLKVALQVKIDNIRTN